MAEQNRACSVTTLPRAAAHPVVNPKRSGRLPNSILSMSKARRIRDMQQLQKARDHLASLHAGMIVKITKPGSNNFGRLCRIVIEQGEDWWTVEPLMGQLKFSDGTYGDTGSIESKWMEPQMTIRR